MEKQENGMPNLSGLPSQEVMPRNANGHVQLASVYSPMQEWRMLYSPEKALQHGTLFEELYKPIEVVENG